MEDSEQYGDGRGKDGKFLPGNKLATNRGENKVSTKAREAIIQFVEDNVDQIQISFDSLKPKEKLDFIANILSYAVPKLSSVQSDVNVKGIPDPTISIVIEKPKDE